MNNNGEKKTVEVDPQRSKKGKRALRGLLRSIPNNLKKPVVAGIAVGVVLVVVGTVGALNGWFGGGAKIPEDTMTRGLVGYWSMDEASGPLVFDKSGQGNDGIHRQSD